MRRGQRKKKKGERSGGEEKKRSGGARNFQNAKTASYCRGYFAYSLTLRYYALLYTIRYLPEYGQLVVITHWQCSQWLDNSCLCVMPAAHATMQLTKLLSPEKLSITAID